MTRKTKYWTGLSITMLVFVSGLIIPSIIEGANIAKNVQNFEAYYDDIEANDYLFIKTQIKESERMYIEFQGINQSIITDVPVIFALMDKDEFTDWLAAGEEKPLPLNTTFLVEQKRGTLYNLKVNFNDDLFFIFYNDFNSTIQVVYNITILPWGHIIACSIVGFLCLIFTAILIIKLSFTLYYNTQADKKQTTSIQYQYSQPQEENLRTKSESEQFCVACGAPVTGKTGRYCQNCGSSITK